MLVEKLTFNLDSEELMIFRGILLSVNERHRNESRDLHVWGAAGKPSSHVQRRASRRFRRCLLTHRQLMSPSGVSMSIQSWKDCPWEQRILSSARGRKSSLRRHLEPTDWSCNWDPWGESTQPLDLLQTLGPCSGLEGTSPSCVIKLKHSFSEWDSRPARWIREGEVSLPTMLTKVPKNKLKINSDLQTPSW